MRDEFLFKSTLITTDYQNSSDKKRYKYSQYPPARPPPPSPTHTHTINALVAGLFVSFMEYPRTALIQHRWLRLISYSSVFLNFNV